MGSMSPARAEPRVQPVLPLRALLRRVVRVDPRAVVGDRVLAVVRARAIVFDGFSGGTLRCEGLLGSDMASEK